METQYREVIDPIRSSLENSILILIRTGAVNANTNKTKTNVTAMKSAINGIFSNIGGGKSDPLSQKNINTSLGREKINEICEAKIEEVRSYKILLKK